MSFCKKPLILASGSLRRKRLLEELNVKFEIRLSDADETLNPNESVERNVVRIAEEKVKASVKAGDRDAIILGADTIVVLDDEILGKPKDQHDAVSMLKRLSDRTHRVYTGFALLDIGSKLTLSDYEMTEVTFRALSDKEIKEYVATGAPMDKAGAYGIQGDISATFASKINGCFYNVVGLPITKLYVSMLNFQQRLGLE
jgi:septum formation protein